MNTKYKYYVDNCMKVNIILNYFRCHGPEYLYNFNLILPPANRLKIIRRTITDEKNNEIGILAYKSANEMWKRWKQFDEDKVKTLYDNIRSELREHSYSEVKEFNRLFYVESNSSDFFRLKIDCVDETKKYIKCATAEDFWLKWNRFKKMRVFI